MGYSDGRIEIFCSILKTETPRDGRKNRKFLGYWIVGLGQAISLVFSRFIEYVCAYILLNITTKTRHYETDKHYINRSVA